MALNGWKRNLMNPVVNYLGLKKRQREFSRPPILIGGCGRSGTTLLLSILGAHPKIHTIPNELGVFIEWHDDVGLYSRGYFADDQKVPRIDRLHRHLLTNKISNSAYRWCEKTPRNIRYLGKILDFFADEVKLIHIIRDGRDVMLSRHPNHPEEYWVDPDRWVNDVQKGLAYKDHSQVLTIKYEDLILDYQTTVQEICDFLNEEYAEEFNSWVSHTNVQKNIAWEGEVKQLHTESIGKWEKEENQARVAEIMAKEEVVQLLNKLDYL